MRRLFVCLLLRAFQQNVPSSTHKPAATAPPIHIDVQLVQMVVNVRDRHTHAPITGLGPKDFSVMQAGQKCLVPYVRMRPGDYQ